MWGEKRKEQHLPKEVTERIKLHNEGKVLNAVSDSLKHSRNGSYIYD